VYPGYFSIGHFHDGSLRYPVDRQGNSSISDALHAINLRQLRDAVNRIASFLEGVSLAYSAYLDYKADMLTAYW